MSGAVERVFVDGGAGKIETVVDRPSDARGAALVAHPHPLYGGTLDNKVVQTLAKTFVELGYVSLPPSGAELLFQILAQRSEKGSVIVTTNLPFSEWISVFTDPRLCKAVVERLTYRSHIVETGTDSYRFKASLGRAKTARTTRAARATSAGPSTAGEAPS